jgi:hypothetical protein
MNLDETAVSGLLRMEEVIPTMEHALADFSSGKVVQPTRVMLPHSPLHHGTGGEPRYLEVGGEVERVEEDPDLEFISAMSQKYLSRYPYPFHQPGDDRVVVFVRPRHTTQMGA